MKKLLTCILFSLAFVLLSSSTALADVFPDNSHYVNRCVKVVNLNDFPNVILIGHLTGPTIKTYEEYQVNNNECLTNGYRGRLSIYWMAKEKFDLGALGHIKTADLTLLLDNVQASGRYTNNSDPLVKEDTEFSIIKLTNGSLDIYKSKKTSEYNNGSQKKIETFSSPLKDKEPNKITPTPTPSPKITPTPVDQPIVIPTPEPVRRGFWQSIACFFSGLFGGGCR